AEASAPQDALEATQVAREPRADIGVDDGRARPLVLAVLTRDEVRERDLAFETECPERTRDGKLMDRVRIAVDEANGDGFDALCRGPLGGRPGVLFPGGRLGGAVGPDSLDEREPESAGDERRRILPEQVVHGIAVTAPQLENVPEAGRGEQPDDPALPLEERVQPHRGPVEEETDGLEQPARDRSVDDLRDPLLAGISPPRPLRNRDLSGRVVVEAEVGERSADVDR